MTDSSHQGGGFLPESGLPSPTPSSLSIRSIHGLPHPRSKALRPNSNKEDLVRRYVEQQLLYISRRYVKKFGQPDPNDTVVGYKSFRETCKDMDNVINVLWLSGTPSLQIPFLFKLASDFTQYVRSFPPSPKASFDLLGKLDHCFSSLLLGQDASSKDPLPGFENGLRGGMTTTDMIRCRSLVEQSRLLMIEVLSRQAGEADEDDEDEDEDETTEDDETSYDTDSTAHGNYKNAKAWDIDEERLHLDAARIFENTIVQLNERLGDQPLTSGPGVTDDMDEARNNAALSELDDESMDDAD